MGMSAITTDEFSGMIRLFNNGSVLDSSESPLCDSEQKISLSSYNFRIKKCIDNNTRCMYPTAPLSQEAKMILHDGCSYRHECDHLNFATVAHDHYYNNRLHSLRIGYSCLGIYLLLILNEFISVYNIWLRRFYGMHFRKQN